VSDRIADAVTAFSGSMAFVARLAVRSRIEFETDIQSDVWSELIAEKLGIDKAEVNRRVRRRLADADRQAESHESPAQADVPSA
jgi:hypothetical protein